MRQVFILRLTGLICHPQMMRVAAAAVIFLLQKRFAAKSVEQQPVLDRHVWKKKMTKKTIIVVAVLLLAVALFVGAGAATGSGSSVNDPIIVDDEAALLDAISGATSSSPCYIKLGDNFNGAEMAGIQVAGDKNFNLNFNTKTLTFTHTPVGSEKTENQCFQILDGAKVTLTNGEIKAKSSKFVTMIQNYGELTLQMMKLDASEGPNGIAAGHVLSINNGKVTLKGITNIIAPSYGNKEAINVCWYPSGGYNKGPSVIVGDQGSTITIVGNIKVEQDDSDKTGKIAPKLTIGSSIVTTVPNINVDGEFKVDAALESSVVINGGTFTDGNVIRYVPLEKKDFVVIKKSSQVTYKSDFLYTVMIPASFDFKNSSSMDGNVEINVATGDPTKKITMKVESKNYEDAENKFILKNGAVSVGYSIYLAASQEEEKKITESPMIVLEREATKGTHSQPLFFTLDSTPDIAGTYTDQLTFTTEVSDWS